MGSEMCIRDRALLRSALQAWWDLWGRPNQVLTHLALLKPALQALGDLWGHPNQVLTHLALLKPALQAWWACGPLRARVWFVLCLRLRFRPEMPFSVSPGRSHCHNRICRGHVSTDCAARPTTKGPTARRNLASANARGTGIRAPEAVPEFTAHAFADHHRRIRSAALCGPKTMNSPAMSGFEAGHQLLVILVIPSVFRGLPPSRKAEARFCGVSRAEAQARFWGSFPG